MGRRHSQNNTARSFFTSSERKGVSWAYTKKQRLGTESFKAFNSCSLCLAEAVDPQACPEGHLFCRECILSCLLEQKEAIKRKEALFAAAQGNRDEDAAAAKAEDEAAAVAAFERAAMGVTQASAVAAPSPAAPSGAMPPPSSSASSSSAASSSTPAAPSLYTSGAPAKYVAPGDDAAGDVAGDAADGDTAEAVEAVKREKRKRARDTSVAFWMPVNAPAGEDTAPKEAPSRATLCPEAPHPLKTKHLARVRFSVAPERHSEEGESAPPSSSSSSSSSSSTAQGAGGAPQCAVCVKALRNGMKLTLLRECGHVFCTPCYEGTVRGEGACFVCQAKFRPGKATPLDGSGTAHSQQVAQKSGGLAFN